MECSPRFPVGAFDIPATDRSPPSNNQVAPTTNNSFQPLHARYRSRESRPRSPSVAVGSNYSHQSSLSTFSPNSSEGNPYSAHYAIAYNSINGPLTGSSGLSFTPSLLWRSDSIVSRNTIKTARSTTSSSSNTSSVRSKHSSMWGTSDTDGSRRSGLRSFLSLDSTPRASADTSHKQHGSPSSSDQSTGMITFAQAGEAFRNSYQRGRAMSVDSAYSVARIPSPSQYAVPSLCTRLASDTHDSIDVSFTSPDYCIITGVRTLQDIPETSAGLLFESGSFNDNSAWGEPPWYHAPTDPLKLSNSSRNQPLAAPADLSATTLKPISPILPSPSTIRAPSRRPSVATCITTTTVRSTIKRARRGEALARLEGKFYEAPPIEDKIESFMGFDDDDSSEDGDKTDDDGNGHLDALSIGLDLQSLPLPLPRTRESSLVASHSTGLASSSSSPQARSLAIESSPGSGGISLHDSPLWHQVNLPLQRGEAKARERAKDMRVQIKSPRLAVLSSQPSPSTPLPSSGGTPPPTSATSSSSRNVSPSSLSSFTPFFDEPSRPRPAKKRHNREKAKKDKGLLNAMGSLESLFSIGVKTGDGESPKLNRFEFETWLELDGDDSGADGTSKKSLP
jgi:hypothetical protein